MTQPLRQRISSVIDSYIAEQTKVGGVVPLSELTRELMGAYAGLLNLCPAPQGREALLEQAVDELVRTTDLVPPSKARVKH